MLISLPKHFTIDKKTNLGHIFKLGIDSATLDLTVSVYAARRISGFILTDHNGGQILLTPIRNWSEIENFDKVIYARPFPNEPISITQSVLEWIKHPELIIIDEITPDVVSEPIFSWRDVFKFKKENLEEDIEGLRSPQIGAVHAALSHWQVTNEPATIVMPTGTGKTETMLSLLIAGNCSKLLIVVPSDALRSQISDKFISLGLLKSLGIIKDAATYPIIYTLNKKPQSIEDVRNIFGRSNVVVTTMSIAGQIQVELQREMASLCTHLFIDEAHHIAADTWSKFKKAFREKNILQFTATPFRNDAKPIKDKIIFNYPLHKAQEEGYFKPIDFLSVYEWDSSRYDRTIADKAIEKLRDDLANGFDHILMARVDSKERAHQVYEIYRAHPDLNPVQIHTGISPAERKVARRKILNKECRVVVCVNMLGEGFDLPELKIAAFHDIKKSLPVTLQLAGRFTRTNRDNNLGNASIIVNLANIEVTEELQELYALDSDWNRLLPFLSEQATQEQIDFYEFMQGFQSFPDEIQLQNVRPAMSAVVYRTNTDTWFPGDFAKGIQNFDNLEQVYFDINSEKRTLVIVTGNRNSVRWGQLKDIFELEWNLYVIYWNQDQQLLYINSSSNSGTYENLAKVVSLDTSHIINAENIFRCLGNIARLKINNVGLKEQLGRLINFSMHTGQDVEPALTPAQLLNKIKSNIFGVGYENGEKTSIGCSYKGRVWSKQNGNIEQFTKWCDKIGDKILDDNINADNVLREAVYAKVINERPQKYPVTIEWHEELYLRDEYSIYLSAGTTHYPLFLTDIELVTPSVDSPIKFKVLSGTMVSMFEMAFNENSIQFRCLENPLSITLGNKVIPLVNFFSEFPPVIRFDDSSWLEGNLFSEYRFNGPAFGRERIDAWQWAGINIRKESQGENKDQDSIQRKVIESLSNEDYDIIFDDDDSGEAADIIAIKVSDAGKAISINLYHLKFSAENFAGARIDDLYAVCGQAQKSIHWKGKGGPDLIKHMINRETRRTTNGMNSRLERGDIRLLGLIKEKSKRIYQCIFKIFIVQPGLSAAQASAQQLELLAVTENHLMETFKIEFGVIGSE
ncbi:MAG TPA: DEAD/DEAH box helicase family protein [Bacteroidales bacterium]|nr:DEAD/DEAH box helicase family protein [Bacteroidales bacterium]HSA44661.1 DEAD/DEAH box helicase family protein [Bacteroidales bacterium]